MGNSTEDANGTNETENVTTTLAPLPAAVPVACIPYKLSRCRNERVVEVFYTANDSVDYLPECRGLPPESNGFYTFGAWLAGGDDSSFLPADGKIASYHGGELTYLNTTDPTQFR